MNKTRLYDSPEMEAAYLRWMDMDEMDQYAIKCQIPKKDMTETEYQRKCIEYVMLNM